MPDDIEFACEFGYTIKLLGIAKKQGHDIELRVHPCMIKKDERVCFMERGLEVMLRQALW